MPSEVYTRKPTYNAVTQYTRMMERQNYDSVKWYLRGTERLNYNSVNWDTRAKTVAGTEKTGEAYYSAAVFLVALPSFLTFESPFTLSFLSFLPLPLLTGFGPPVLRAMWQGS